MIRSALRLSLLALALAGTAASAATVVATLPDFDGPFAPGGYPADLGTIGTFTYSLPGNAVITSATIGGTYGTAAFNTSTAGFDVVVDGAQLTACIDQDPCWVGSLGAFAPFSLALPSWVFGALSDGSADLGIIMTSDSVVRYGTPTLTIDYNVVPEPGTWALLIAGFGLTGVALRRRTAALA